MNFEPQGDRLLIEHVEQADKSAGGVFLPDTAKEKPQEGIIRAVGEFGRIFESTGATMPQKLKVGQRVLFSKYSGSEVKLDGKEYLVISAKDILGVFTDAPVLAGVK